MRKTESQFSLVSTKIKPLSVAILMALGTAGAEAAVIEFSFGNSATPGVQGTDFNYAACGTIDFTAGAEFRMCQANGASLGGGKPFQKDTINGTETWSFDADTGLMTGVGNTVATGGINTELQHYTMIGYLPPSGDPDGGIGLDQGAILLSNYFGFLAPFVGSGAGNLYGEGQYTATSATTFELFFPVLEMQWAGGFIPMGAGGDNGVTFLGTTDGTNFSMWAEHKVTLYEEGIAGAGFNDWSAQWYYTGTIAEVPIPAAVWLFGSGLLGLVGLGRQKKKALACKTLTNE